MLGIEKFHYYYHTFLDLEKLCNVSWQALFEPLGIILSLMGGGCYRVLGCMWCSSFSLLLAPLMRPIFPLHMLCAAIAATEFRSKNIIHSAHHTTLRLEFRCENKT
jgi:hypothetical protein